MPLPFALMSKLLCRQRNIVHLIVFTILAVLLSGLTTAPATACCLYDGNDQTHTVRCWDFAYYCDWQYVETTWTHSSGNCGPWLCACLGCRPCYQIGPVKTWFYLAPPSCTGWAACEPSSPAFPDGMSGTQQCTDALCGC